MLSVEVSRYINRNVSLRIGSAIGASCSDHFEPTQFCSPSALTNQTSQRRFVLFKVMRGEVVDGAVVRVPLFSK